MSSSGKKKQGFKTQHFKAHHYPDGHLLVNLDDMGIICLWLFLIRRILVVFVVKHLAIGNVLLGVLTLQRGTN